MGEAKQFEVLHCPRCYVAMRLNPDNGFWRCPRCKGEFWEDEKRLRELEQEKKQRDAIEDLNKQTRWSLSMSVYYPDPLPAGPAEPSGGGSRNSGRKKKKPKRNAGLITERYVLE